MTRRKIDRNLWLNPNGWPVDSAGYVFLARAFDEIGRARFGAEWDRKPPPHPDENDDDDASVEADAAWLKANELWEKASEEAEAKSAEMRAAVRREIAEQCLRGHLHAAVRPKRGGEMTKVPEDCWNTENLDRRFDRCQMSLIDPFSDAGFDWIYLTRASLDEYLTGQPYAAPNAPNNVHLSPYLKLMVAISKKMNITPDHQPKKGRIDRSTQGKVDRSGQVVREPSELDGNTAPGA